MSSRTIEEIRDYFAGDKYAMETTGVEILEAEEGYCKVRLCADERHRNAAGRIMGAVYYTMADFAFAVACNAQLKEPVSFTLDSRISFLQAARSSVLFAEAKVVRSGGKISFYTIEVTDDTGTLVAAVYSTGYRPG